MPFDDTTGFLAPAQTHPRAAEIAVLDELKRKIPTTRQWCKHALKNGSRHCLSGALNTIDHGHYWYLFDHRNDVPFGVSFTRVEVASVWERLSAIAMSMLSEDECDEKCLTVPIFNNLPRVKYHHIDDLLRRTRASFEAEN